MSRGRALMSKPEGDDGDINAGLKKDAWPSYDGRYEEIS